MIWETLLMDWKGTKWMESQQNTKLHSRGEN